MIKLKCLIPINRLISKKNPALTIWTIPKERKFSVSNINFTNDQQNNKKQPLHRMKESMYEIIGLRILWRMGMIIPSRFARGIILSVPLIGGILALQGCLADYQRSKSEKSKKASKLFFIASVLNGLDVVVNIAIAGVLLFDETKIQIHHSRSLLEFVQTLPHTLMTEQLPNEVLLAMLEIGSISTAILATCFAVCGEIKSENHYLKERNRIDMK